MTPSMSPSLLFIVLTFYACIVTANDNDSSYSDEGPYDEEIKCYNLPYGGFGFLSHVLTYYTMALLCIHGWEGGRCLHGVSSKQQSGTSLLRLQN